MKQVSHTTTYAGTTVDAVYAMLGDPAYRRAVGDYQGVLDLRCDIEPSGAGMTVRLEQAHATDGVPSFAQRMVGAEIRFVQQETWSSPTASTIQVTIPGKPGEMAGTASLTQSGSDVVQRVDLAVKVGVPLIGGKLEDLVAGFMTKALDAETRVGARWLKGEWRS